MSDEKSGYWIWNIVNNALLFVNRDAAKDKSRLSISKSASVTSLTKKQTVATDFKEPVSNVSKMRFRKFYQRKVKITDPDVVTIQDVKDVAIFSCNKKILSPEFISFFHTKEMDRFLRSLIIYFQFYFQIWNKLQLRRVEAKRKLRQPIVEELENYVRDDLADLRSMLARDYAVILLGIGDAKKFHHMNNKNNDSFSDRDRHLMECLVIMACRVVWIALNRKYITLIENEVNRLLRTAIFNPIMHNTNRSTAFDPLPEEERILVGKACKNERKLHHKSPAIQEITFDNHDYRMLCIGICDPGYDGERQRYLEAAYAAPEEDLDELNIGVGCLGVKRKHLDFILKPLEISTTKKRTSVMKVIPEFVIPSSISRGSMMDISENLPKSPSKYQESQTKIQARKNQCRMWREFIVSKETNPMFEISVSGATLQNL